MSRKSSLFNALARGARKSDVGHWPHDEPLDPLDAGQSQPAATSPPPVASNHQVSVVEQGPLQYPPHAHSFLDIQPTEASPVVALDASASPAPSHEGNHRHAGIQTSPDEASGGLATRRRGSFPMFKEAGRILLLGKMFGRRIKNKRWSGPPAEAQPPPSPPAPSRPLSPQRPPRTAGILLNSEEREWGRHMLNDAAHALLPLAPSLPVPPFLKNVVVFPKIEGGAAEPSQRIKILDVPPQSSRPPHPARSPSCPQSQSKFSFASLPPSTSLSACASSILTSQFSVPSGSVPPKRESDSVQKIGLSNRQPELPRQPQKCWKVLQYNKIRIPSLKEGKWITGGVLGSGGFGRVYYVYNIALQKPCAMKVVCFARGISKSACVGIINELKVLSLLAEEEEHASPFLLRPCVSDGLWAWRTSKGSLHILTEVCGGGTLQQYRYRISYPSLILVCAEIILGLNWLHEHGIVHHDLKPPNILVDAKGHCVIADFGGARFLDEQGKLTRNMDTSAIMTTPFAAPEVLARLEEGEVREYDEAVDYWSLGATVVSMFLDEEYLPGSTNLGFMTFRVGKIQSQMRQNNLPEELEAFVMDLLCMDPAERCTYPAITKQRIFQHTNWLDVEHQCQPAIIALKDLASRAHGCSFATPKVHESTEATANFLKELRAQHLSLEVDDSFDLDKHHANMTRYLSGRIVPPF